MRAEAYRREPIGKWVVDAMWRDGAGEGKRVNDSCTPVEGAGAWMDPDSLEECAGKERAVR